ncbi:MAG: T9SS type A sorting domain-containing protein, partial [Bacteroidota bacterium]
HPMHLSASAARRRLASLHRSAAAGTLTLAMLHGTDARAQAPTPASDEFRVNTVTQSFQVGPAVDADADGDFVVTWDSYGQDGSFYGIYAQRYAVNPVAIENDAALPTALVLEATYPNPARDAATLRYALPTAADVHVTVTDLLGRTVLSRTEGAKPAGRHAVQLTLDGLSSGVYVVRVNAQGATATKRLTVVR